MPLTKSPSFITHNALFRQIEMNAIYVKIPLALEEAKEAFDLIQALGFGGLSVTHPLKAAFADDVYNTVRWDEGVPTFYNSDGLGMLDAIEQNEPVLNKTLIIIGAGATAKACAREAIRRGARVVIINRTEAKAHALAKQLGCQSAPISAVKGPYDLLLNATTVNFSNPKPTADVSLDTPSGKEMWLRQAAYQFCFWNAGLHYEEVLATLREICRNLQLPIRATHAHSDVLRQHLQRGASQSLNV